ncbi:transporter, major facilitator family [Trichuris trichiura]|uniref:Transporter, major facilitator family n=1 Tax=Trichuris trichiura TaxID=36087 RepID=A0A077Z9R8_TRITR|nr:transporter, major facilitator family [Trichuris trichiura]
MAKATSVRGEGISLQGVIVVIAGFLSQMISEGIVQAQDVFPPYVHEYFKCTFAEACVFHSLMHGFSEVMGPVSTFLTKRFNERSVVVLGATVITLGFLGCSFSTRLFHLNIASATAGIGFGLISVPIVTVVSFHFDQNRRYVMTTAATIGGALGAALFPFALDAILDQNPWQFTFVMIACCTAQLLYLGLLLSRPTNSNLEIAEKESLLSMEPEIAIVDGFAVQNISAASYSLKSRLVVPMFLLSSLFWHVGSYVFEVLPLRLDHESYNGDQIALVISMQATFIIFGRLVAAGFIGKLRADPVLVYNLGSMIVALNRTLISWPNSYTAYLALIASSGLGIGIATALVPSVVLKLVGLERLNFIFGLELLMRGVSGMIVPIVGAYLADTLRGDFFYTFLIGGISMFIATICLLPYHWPWSTVLSTEQATLHCREDRLAKLNDG